MAHTILTNRFEDALVYANHLHTHQRRKGKDTPYISHLLGVTALVLDDHGSEDMAIAALLHDSVEDQGGVTTLSDIRHRFGDRVADLVAGCTDSYTTPKPAWKTRKLNYLEHLKHADIEIQRISLADKLYNARTILNDVKQEGERVWKRFNGGKEGSLWYYRKLADLFLELNTPSWMVADLNDVVTELENIAV